MDGRCGSCVTTSGSRGGSWGPAAPCPKIVSNSCSFQAIFRANLYFLGNFGLGAPTWSQNSTGPLNKILDPPFSLHFECCRKSVLHLFCDLHDKTHTPHTNIGVRVERTAKDLEILSLTETKVECTMHHCCLQPSSFQDLDTRRASCCSSTFPNGRKTN